MSRSKAGWGAWLSCVVALSGCAPTTPKAVAEAKVEAVRGRQVPAPPGARCALAGTNRAEILKLLAGSHERAISTTAGGELRLVSRAPAWVETIEGGELVLIRLDAETGEVIGELRLPGGGETFVEGTRLIHVAHHEGEAVVRAVSLLLGYVVEEWRLGADPLAFVELDARRGVVVLEQGAFELTLSPGNPVRRAPKAPAGALARAAQQGR